MPVSGTSFSRQGSAVPAGKPAEPVGAAGAVEDELLMEIVGQDYGMVRKIGG